MHAPALLIYSYTLEAPHAIHLVRSAGSTTSPTPHGRHVPSVLTFFLSAKGHALRLQVLVFVSSSKSLHGSQVPVVLNLCLGTVHVGS